MIKEAFKLPLILTLPITSKASLGVLSPIPTLSVNEDKTTFVPVLFHAVEFPLPELSPAVVCTVPSGNITFPVVTFNPPLTFNGLPPYKDPKIFTSPSKVEFEVVPVTLI